MHGVGPTTAATLAAAGLTTVADLLWHLPLRFEDRTEVVAVADVPETGAVTVAGTLAELRRVPLRRRGASLLRGRVVDESGQLPAVWFNRPYLLSQVDTAAIYRLSGEMRVRAGARELVVATMERADGGAVHSGRIVPVYPALAGGDEAVGGKTFGPAQLRRLFDRVFAALDLATIVDPLPSELVAAHGLPTLAVALRGLHQPDGAVKAADLEARCNLFHARLAYQELLALQLQLASKRRSATARNKSHTYRVDDGVRAVARQVLPFKLTAAQKRVLREIADDLRRPTPMLRLLQGEVGSGKTIVAALAMVIALESGLQVAFMAPTELLAQQQWRSLERLLGQRYRIALVTASTTNRRPTAPDGIAQPAAWADLARHPSQGGAHVAVGTHALFTERVRFAKLGLVVIDEQHRFGVSQRLALTGKGARPDLLVMTATPIPRSLALAVYGDLDLSVLDELPPGRLPIDTRVLSGTAGRRRAWEMLRGEVAKGGRAYVVVPRIAEVADTSTDPTAASEPAGLSLERLLLELPELLGDLPWAVAHGRMPPGERAAALGKFAAGEASVLVATTVIEVGVDDPGASLMLIESAERFGLAQLHQLRGRVGRGTRPSRCLAVRSAGASAAAVARLQAFAATTDGFALADADLTLRGPGELLGTRQSGAPLLTVARLPDDLPWLERARDDARQWLDRPELAGFLATARDRFGERRPGVLRAG